MMSAKEALKIVQDAQPKLELEREAALKELYDDVFAAIKHESELGHTWFDYNKVLPKDVIFKLQSLGYEVRPYSYVKLTAISWGDV